MAKRRLLGLRKQLFVLGVLGVLPFALLLIAHDMEERTLASHNAEQHAVHLSLIGVTGQTLQIKNSEQILKALSVVPDIWNVEKCNSLMSELLAQNPRFANFGVIGPDGNLVCSGIPFTSPVSGADRLYFKKAIEMRGFAIGEYQIGRITGKPTVNFGFPVYRPDGTLRGVVFAALNLLWLNRVFEGIHLPPDTEVFIFDRTGTILAHHPNPDAWIGNRYESAEIIQFITRAGREGTAMAPGIDGIDRLFAFSPLPTAFGAEETYVAVGLSSAVASAEANHILRRDIFIIALAVMTLILFGWVAMERVILRRLQAIIDASKRFARGDFSGRVPTVMKDEIGDLGIAFNKMAGQLEGLYAHLEERVAEKTRQLTQKVTEIEEERRLLEALLNNLPVAVIVAKAPSGQLMITNNLGRGLLRLDGKKIGSLKEYGFLREDGTPVPERENPIADTLLRGETRINQTGMFFMDRNGRMIALRVSSAAVNSRDQVKTVVVVLDDMTKELAIDKAKSEFVSLASHQLRTPLTATNWFCEMLLAEDGGRLTKGQKDLVSHLYESNRRMVELVNSLLNVSRIESGKFSIEPEDINLRQVVKDLLSELEQHVNEKGQFVDMDFDGATTYRGDQKLIRIVLENYLLNAIRYTPRGGHITVKVSVSPQGVRFEVKDTGIGIPKDEQSMIFTKLFRGSNVRKIETEGSGLGLYIVKLLVEQVGGAVGFESTEGKGSTFSATLPISGMKKRAGEKRLT
ncbi:HAMP domain-containing protein [Candidatus Uhrbacteria bacterium]|nr:HAMP domain-containing protein [Candidatus Uhrbacteria bacterium]